MQKRRTLGAILWRKNLDLASGFMSYLQDHQGHGEAAASHCGREGYFVYVALLVWQTAQECLH